MNEKATLELLQPIQDPETRLSIVESGLAKVTVDGDVVSVDVGLSTPTSPRAPLEDAIRTALTKGGAPAVGQFIHLQGHWP